MSEIPASHSAEAGTVTRVGSELLITAPPAMPQSSWLALTQELQMFADASAESDQSVSVSVDQAVTLRDVLARPWPAGRWPWTWAVDAARAADRANLLKTAVDNLLASDQPLDLEQLDESLAASGFRRRLLSAQRSAVAALATARSGGNFSVPGSGKTTMTYAAYALLRHTEAVDRMLVIAPQSAYEAWAEEAEACFEPGHVPLVEIAPASPRRRSEVVVFNYERAAMGGVRAAIDAWAQGHRFLVVFDEAHRAKRGADGLHGRGALDIAGLAEARLVLTGTPMPNGPEDLVSMLDLAWPGHGSRLADTSTLNAERAWVRITKDDLELAEAEVLVEPVELDHQHARLYSVLAEGLLSDPLLQAEHPAFAEKAIMRLIACASNPLLLTSPGGRGELLRWAAELPNSSSIEALLHDVPASVRPAKLLAVARRAERHAKAKTKLLVWTNFIGNVRELERLLAPYGTASITGATPRSDPDASTDRERELRRFREDSDCTVLIATPQTLGEGVSLHKVCQDQVHVDRTFNAGQFLQAMDRTHRVGMPEGTTAKVTVLMANGTIDERINHSLMRKIAAMNTALNDPTLDRLSKVTLGASEPAISPAEISGLLGHLRDIHTLPL